MTMKMKTMMRMRIVIEGAVVENLENQLRDPPVVLNRRRKQVLKGEEEAGGGVVTRNMKIVMITVLAITKTIIVFKMTARTIRTW